MPTIDIYLPRDQYDRLKAMKHRSKLVQKLLRIYWEGVDEKDPPDKEMIKSEKGRDKEHYSSRRNSNTPSSIKFNMRGV